MNFVQLKSLIVAVTFLLIPASQAMAQTDDNKGYNMTSIHPDGNQISGGNFMGTVLVNMVAEPDDSLNTVVGKVRFKPKARTNWHSHAGGQILIITDGVGYYKEKGKPALIIRKGDVIKAPANILHWHGGSHEQSMTHSHCT